MFASHLAALLHSDHSAARSSPQPASNRQGEARRRVQKKKPQETASDRMTRISSVAAAEILPRWYRLQRLAPWSLHAWAHAPPASWAEYPGLPDQTGLAGAGLCFRWIWVSSGGRGGGWAGWALCSPGRGRERASNTGFAIFSFWPVTGKTSRQTTRRLGRARLVNLVETRQSLARRSVCRGSLDGICGRHGKMLRQAATIARSIGLSQQAGRQKEKTCHVCPMAARSHPSPGLPARSCACWCIKATD